MSRGRYAIRLDPFAAECGGAIQLPEAREQCPAVVDTTVESPEWKPLRPAEEVGPGRVFFVDGVRRIEHRLLVDEGERTLFGLLGSFGVGATSVSGERRRPARIGHEEVGRVAVVGGGLKIAPFRAEVPRAARQGTVLAFLPEAVPENTPVAPMDGLQKAMRRREALLAEALSVEADVVYLDGPLTYLTATHGAVVGFVKRLQREYLSAAQSLVLRRLATGERTPLFLIKDAAPRYSWYQKIGGGRPIDSALTGVVRLEVSAALELGRARTLADTSARLIPRFASDPAHDPRAPQNLFPIGALETQLRRLLGDTLLVRRAIESQLQREVA
jgi:uncharacterized protein